MRLITFWKILIIFLILLILGVTIFLAKRPPDLAPGLKTFGITFSKPAAEALGLDWKEVYLKTLDDLRVRKIRLSAYWSEIEKSAGQYVFDDLDWQIKEADKRNARIILAVGERLPRWPECHIPEWATNLPAAERQEELLKFIGLIVSRYKSSPVIAYWQVENEPFLATFGICPKFNKEFLDKEIGLVKSLDSRPVIVSDSGELSSWFQAASRADIFGTTMYRIVWGQNIPGDGYLQYWLPPSFFHLKANLIRYLVGVKDIIVVELQAEPWGPKSISEMSSSERDVSLSIGQFKKNVEYAGEIGFREAYLWGTEWWYWEKLNGRPEFWEYAKDLMNK